MIAYVAVLQHIFFDIVDNFALILAPSQYLVDHPMYLTDVVVGMFLGIACGVASIMLFHAIVPQDLFFAVQ